MRFFTKGQDVSIYNLGSKNNFNFQILFLTPFCDQKLYYRVFSQLYAQILIKKPKTAHNLILYKTRKKKKTTLRKNPLQILILFLIKPQKKCKKTTLRKNLLQILILFFIKPERK